MNRKPDGTIEFSLTITPNEVNAAKTEHLKQAAKTIEIKGFRKGKAPVDVVEKHLDPQKLAEQVLDHLLPAKLAAQLKTHNLHPISNPHLKIVSMEAGKDWQFTIEIAEFPKFELGEYKPKVKAALQSTKIITSASKINEPTPTEDKKLTKVFDALLESTFVPIPKLLIDEEVNRSLSRLLNQVQKLGLTIEQYLTSLKKTSQSLREEYERTAKDNLKLEFILHQIAKDLNITVDPQEIDAAITAIPDPKTRESYNTPSERAYISNMMQKRKTIDALLKLA